MTVIVWRIIRFEPSLESITFVYALIHTMMIIINGHLNLYCHFNLYRHFNHSLLSLLLYVMIQYIISFFFIDHQWYMYTIQQTYIRYNIQYFTLPLQLLCTTKWGQFYSWIPVHLMNKLEIMKILFKPTNIYPYMDSTTSPVGQVLT